MAYNRKKVLAVLKAYREGEMYTREIARAFEVSTSTITGWAVKAGYKLRSRGLHKRIEPTVRQKKILEMVERNHSYKAIGKKFGMTKQAVHHVLRRWRRYRRPRRPPFGPGDVIQFQGRRYTVLAANLDNGTLLDEKGFKHRCFAWSRGGRTPRKVGFDARHAPEPVLTSKAA
jgi:hypothetical protein